MGRRDRRCSTVPHRGGLPVGQEGGPLLEEIRAVHVCPLGAEGEVGGKRAAADCVVLSKDFEGSFAEEVLVAAGKGGGQAEVAQGRHVFAEPRHEIERQPLTGPDDIAIEGA